MKKILFVTRDFPVTEDCGASIRELYIAKCLSPHFDLDIAYQIPCDRENIKHQLFKNKFFIPQPQYTKTTQSIRSLFTGESFHNRFKNSDIVKFINASDYDWIYFSWIHTSIDIHYLMNQNTIVDLVDATSRFYQNSEPLSKLRSIYYKLEQDRLRRVEHNCIEAATITLVTTSKEKQYLTDSNPSFNDKILTIGNEPLTPISKINSSYTPKRIGFIGSLDWYTNAEAVEKLTTEIYPKIKLVFPDAELYIIGKGESNLAEKFKDIPGVVFTGFIENLDDIMPTIELMIFPHLTVTGIQNKLISAFSYGIPVVFSSEMIFTKEINAIEHECAVSNNESSSFAAKAIDILGNSDRRNYLSQWTLKFITNYFTDRTEPAQLINFLLKTHTNTRNFDFNPKSKISHVILN
jgi:polysaccharide biosynthesis protein PslH